MTLIEAWNAAFCNRTVKHGSRKAVIYGKSLRWVGESGSYDDLVPVAEGLLDGWELVPEPPKRYTFEEAYEKMKAGTWMKCDLLKPITISCGTFVYRNDNGTNSSTTLTPHHIESKWVEA